MKSFFGSFERMIRFKNTPEAICGEGAALRVKPKICPNRTPHPWQASQSNSAE